MASEKENDADATDAAKGKKPRTAKPSYVIPESWSLTEQQKAFIDLFSEDDADNKE
ncbi:hypothetical protein [Atlantibacter sp.]|uniref:hypothetical protein n=1 Tax=Atlantibacter sp. TaxID=1903473 RepID=UPI002897CF46|nr:hypothetical protein [Atlantibacter sp.]